MKKLMFTAAVAAAGGLMAIESANTVGYTTQSWMNKGTYYMMGMQFETTTGGSVKLGDIDFGGMTGPFYDSNDEFLTTAPQIQLAFPNREGTTAYYFLADGNETYDGPGWTDQFGTAVNPDVSAALGFWYRNTTSTTPTFTMAGQVVPDSPFEKTFNASWRMLVNPFPVDTKLSDIGFDGIATSAPAYDDADAFHNTATAVQIPFADREGFTSYYYLADGNATYDGPGWTDKFGTNVDPATIVIPAGRGCWFRPATTMTVTFTK